MIGCSARMCVMCVTRHQVCQSTVSEWCVCPQADHVKADEHVMVDAHILATPNIADIDGDGHEELVIAVSYFYDKE